MKIRLFHALSVLSVAALTILTVSAAPKTPQFSALDASVVEGDSGLQTLVFPVYLGVTSPRRETVTFSTSSGTATAGRDFDAVRGTLVFAPGVRRVDVRVPVRGDLVYEGNETLSLHLGRASVPLARADATGTIVDNERKPRLSVGDVRVVEGNAGQKAATFPLTLSGPCQNQVSVHFATRDGSATSPSDFKAVAGNLVFASGQTSKTVSVAVVGDTQPERDEFFRLELSAASVALARSSATAIIQNDDKTPPPTPTPQPTATVTPTATPEPEPTATPTEVPTATPEPAATDIPTVTPEPTVAPTEVPTATPEPAATDIPTVTPEPRATEVPTATPEPTSTEVPTATPLATNTPEPTATPTPTPMQSGGILWSSNVTNNRNVSGVNRMDADGSNPSALTSDSLGNCNAVWSPNRRYIAFESYNSTNGSTFIYRMDSDGTHRIAIAVGTHPAWSPDGTHIVFIANGDIYGDVPNSSYHLVIMNADGTGKTALRLTSTNCYVPAWSPDGRQIAFIGSAPLGLSLLKVNANGTGLTRLFTDASLGSGLSWSPDGKTIAFGAAIRPSANSYAPMGIYTITTGASKPIRLTSLNSYSINPVWSPDGTRIAYSSDNHHDLDIYSMKIDGSDAKQLTSAATDEIATDWKGAAGTPEPAIAPTPPPFVPPAASGPGKLLFSNTTYNDNTPQHLFEFNADATNRREIVLPSNVRLSSEAVWNADASKIAFIGSGPGAYQQLFVAGGNGSNAVPVLLPYDLQPVYYIPPTLSPDGTRLAFIAKSRNSTSSTNALWVVGVDGSSPTQLLGDNCYDSQWSPDGTRIAFSSPRDDASNSSSQIFTIRTDGTDLTRLSDSSAIPSMKYPVGDNYRPNWSPDARQLAFINYNANSPMSLWSVGADGAAQTQLFVADPNAAPFGTPQWSPDGARIAFSLDQNRNRTDQIQVVNADGTGYSVILNNGDRNILTDWKSGFVPPPAGDSPPRSSSSAPSS